MTTLLGQLTVSNRGSLQCALCVIKECGGACLGLLKLWGELAHIAHPILARLMSKPKYRKTHKTGQNVVQLPSFHLSNVYSDNRRLVWSVP